MALLLLRLALLELDTFAFELPEELRLFTVAACLDELLLWLTFALVLRAVLL